MNGTSARCIAPCEAKRTPDRRDSRTGTHESLYADGGLYREIVDSNARTLNIGRLAATVLPADAFRREVREQLPHAFADPLA